MNDVDAIAITTNGIRRKDGAAVMGAGVAKAAAQRYPGLDQRLGDLLAKSGNHVYILHRASEEPWQDEPRDLVSFPTKHHWRDPSDLQLIRRSAEGLVKAAEHRGWASIALPRPGCGLGGLDWEKEVRPLLAELWDDRFRISAGH